MEEKLVQFLRKRDYVLVEELSRGRGATGTAVLLRDDILDEYFVCKKYTPYSETHREELFNNFVREIKLLFKIFHPNLVRIYNYYLYPEHYAGYILMEHIKGKDIENYIRSRPEQTNEIFIQTIEAFRYLESQKILHRDIRPSNILVRDDGTVKVIDLGFGKRIEQSLDFDKSIDLNWWCELPDEFTDSVYDFKSEVYFVGKLFEKFMRENGIDHFQYESMLARMCNKNPDLRISSFFDVQKEIENDLFIGIEFSKSEMSSYREFSYHVTEALAEIVHGIVYIDDVERIQTQLEAVYRSCMLEQYVPDPKHILRCFLVGEYVYLRTEIPVNVVKNFLHLMKSTSHEKQRIIIANFHTRLDATNRSYKDLEDEIPF